VFFSRHGKAELISWTGGGGGGGVFAGGKIRISREGRINFWDGLEKKKGGKGDHSFLGGGEKGNILGGVEKRGKKRRDRTLSGEEKKTALLNPEINGAGSATDCLERGGRKEGNSPAVNLGRGQL